MDMLAECQEMRQPHRWRLKGLCVIGSLTIAAGLYALTAPAVWATGMACVITSYDEISIGTPVEGLIQTVPVDRGDWVTKGQVILTLESSFEEATVALAKAKAEAEAALKSSQVKIGFTGRKFERAQELFKTNSIAQHEVDEAQTEKALAETAYREATEQKRQAELN